MQLRDFDGAVREAVAATQVAPDDPDAHGALARALGATSKTSEAVDSLRRAIALAPKRADLHDDLGTLLVQQNQCGRSSFRI